jgi:hypothetical protein
MGAPYLLHETLGCPIANLQSARSDLWEPQFVLRPTQLRKKHCFVKSTSNDLTAVGIRGSPKDFGTPVAKIDSPRGESIMPRYALRSDQLRTKAASLILPQMALRDKIFTA